MTASGEDRASFAYLVGRVGQGVRREMRARLAGHGLSVAEFTALSVLRRRPGLSNAQLARRAMITPQAMIEVLAELERRGLVRRRADAAHRRVLRAELTPRGERLLDAAEPPVLALEGELLAGVPDRQRAAVLDALHEAMRRLSTGGD